MKKVIYSVSRFNKFGNNKLTGIGFITEKDLIIACVSQKGNAYIRVFEDCIKNCHWHLSYKHDYYTHTFIDLFRKELK